MTVANMRFAFDTPNGAAEVEMQVRPESSDLMACQQVFGTLDYDLRRLRRYNELSSLYNKITSQGRTPLVIDLGANIGMATLYFARAWPGCHVVAVEPALDNFQLLLKNTESLDKVTASHAGVSSTRGNLRVANPDAEKWAYRTIPVSDSDPESVPAVTVGDLLEEFSPTKGYDPFVIKIDIEGAEADLFSTNTDWVQHFPLLIVELHDWLLCGQASSQNFLRTITPLGRDFVYIGENIFSIANPR